MASDFEEAAAGDRLAGLRAGACLGARSPSPLRRYGRSTPGHAGL